MGCYLIGIAVLVAFLDDGFIEIYEALILFAMYIGYCTLMKFNVNLMRVANKIQPIEGLDEAEEEKAAEEQIRRTEEAKTKAENYGQRRAIEMAQEKAGQVK